VLPYRCLIRQIRRSFGSSIHSSARVLLNSLSCSEEAASGNGKRDRDGESIGYYFHSTTSLRRKPLQATKSSGAPGKSPSLAITTSRVFFAIVIWLSPRRATVTHPFE